MTEDVFQFPLVTVGGLVVSPDGDILLVKAEKWSGLWSVPGGKVEIGEKLEEGFIREVREETGLDVTDVRFAIVQDSIFSKEFWKKRHFVMHDYIAKLAPHCQKDDVVLNDEAQEYLWISPEAAKKLPLIREVRLLVEWYTNR